MKNQQIRALVKIADTGSIRSAAAELGTSQSALTRSMKELEENFGAELLSRSYRGISFTPAGDALLKRARMILATIERAKDEVAQISGGKGAKVSIGITPVVSSTVFPDIYRQFKHKLPDADLVLTEGLLTTIVPGLIEGHLDFGVAIATQSELPTELVFTPLCNVSIAVTGRKGHPLAKEQDWEKLLEASWVLNISLGSSSNGLLSWLDEQGLPRPKEIVQCTSPQIMLEMMRRTDLIGFGPTRYMSDSLSGQGLEPFAIQPLPPMATLGIVRVRGMPLTPAAQEMETLVQRLLMSNFSEELSRPPWRSNTMAKGIFPKHHWRELLAHLGTEKSKFVEIEITQYGVIVDHTMVSFITDTDSDYEFKVARADLLKTDTEELVTLHYETDQLSVICEVAGTLVRMPAVAL